MRLDFITQSLVSSSTANCQQASRRLAASAAKLDALSPLKVLGRGYAIVYKDEAVVKSVGEAAAGDHLNIKLADGELSCTVN